MITGVEVRPGFYVQLTGDKETEGKLYCITSKEAFDYETARTTGTAEFSTVASGGNSGYRNVDRIEPDVGQIAWVQWYTRDGCDYQMKLKAGSIRFGPQQEPNVGFINNEKSGPTDPNPSYSFWLFRDWFPSLIANNVTPFTLTPKLYFEGFKFDVDKIGDVNEIMRIKLSGKFSIITLGGVTKS